MALGKPTGGASKATRARIQEAIEQVVEVGWAAEQQLLLKKVEVATADLAALLL